MLVDIDECARGKCSNHAPCQDFPGGYTCGPSCYPGYEGDPNIECKDINECSVGVNGHPACDALTQCENQGGTWTCCKCFIKNM